jgi:PAS domain S-box-containing protein
MAQAQRLEQEVMALREEVAALRERLHEAEEVRRAIERGEVDAFVVGPRQEDKRVLLLAGAYSRYRQLIDEMEQGTVTVGTQGEILFANRRFADIAGAALGELYRARLAEYLHADDRAAVASLLRDQDAAEGGIEVRLVRPGGGQARVRVTLASTWEHYSTLVVTDLSQEEAAAEARQTLEAIRRGEVDAFVMGETVVTLNNAPDPYQVLADRIQQGAVTLSARGRIVYANARLLRMLGVPAERLLGMPFENYVSLADRPAVAALLEPPHNGRPPQAEVRLLRQGAEPLEVVLSAATLAEGQSMWLVTDITEAKRHRAADERTRKFLGMLAHEFRNMLNTMRTSVDLLEHETGEADRRNTLDTLKRHMQRMLHVVEDLRTINPKD